MKLGPAVIGILIAGALGYLLEPLVRPALLPAPKKVADKEEEKGPNVPAQPLEPAPAAPANTPAAAPSAGAAPAWVATLSPEQLPAKVKLTMRAVLPIAGSTEPMTLPPGVEVTSVRVEGNDLVILPFGAPPEAKVPVMSTDLVAMLGNAPPPVPVAPPVAVVEPTTPAVTPVEPVTPEPSASGTKLSPEEIVAVMQASIKAGEIKEFTFEQVLGWKADEEKESDGEIYQTGLASYKAETIFGVKNIQAQALIEDGKVKTWIWPKSGMEIK